MSFREALKRSFSVLYYGMGFGVPIITLITFVTSFEQLKDKGFTKWDESGGFTVTHDQIGIVRIVCFAVISVLGLYITIKGI